MDAHLLDRGRIHADLNFALDGTAVATHDDPNPDLEYAEFAVWNLLIDGPEATILWDTGSHPAAESRWPAPLYQAFAHPDADDRDLETALGEAGYAVDDVDCVVQSHLHLDHAGGLYHFEGTDVPVYVHRRELAHAYLSARTEAGGDAYLAGDFDRELNWRVVDRRRRQLVDGIELLHVPGHTPGLLGAHVERDGEDLLVAGDAAFLAANYEAERSMGASLLYDSRAAADSVAFLKDVERRHDARVLYGHDPEQFERLHGSL